MATLARRLRQRLGVTMFMGLVGTLCWCDVPALASANTIPLPPQVAFVDAGQFTGTFQTQGVTLPITGTLDYLSGLTQYVKLHVSFDIGGQQIARDSSVISTATVINECEIVSSDPTTCRQEVLSGGSYPQCGTAWSQTQPGIWNLGCTVTMQGKKAALDFLVELNAQNQLVRVQENITIGGMKDSLNLIMTEQGTTPPSSSDFNRPGICSAPNGNNQGGNGNNQGQNGNSQGQDGNSQGQIPMQSLLWLI